MKSGYKPRCLAFILRQPLKKWVQNTSFCCINLRPEQGERLPHNAQEQLYYSKRQDANNIHPALFVQLKKPPAQYQDI
jgi:hypothetical protein